MTSATCSAGSRMWGPDSSCSDSWVMALQWCHQHITM